MKLSQMTAINSEVHYLNCQDENCELAFCVDRRNPQKCGCNEWQPIETAPKEREVLLWNSRLKFWFVGWAQKIDHTNDFDYRFWMPLPEPPGGT